MTSGAETEAAARRVLALLQSGRYLEAERESGRLIEAAPQLADAWHLRAMARRELGRLQEARADMAVCLEREPGNSMAWLHAGQLEAALGDTAAACRSFARAAELGPDNAEAWYRHGRCELDQGRPDAAVAALSQAAASAPGVPLVQAALVLALVRAGRAEEAAARLNSMSPLATRHGETLFQLARAHAALGMAAEAEAYYRGALGAPDVSRVAVLNNLGLLLQEVGRLDEAIALFEEAVQLDPGNWRSLSNLAYGELRRGGVDAVMAIRERLRSEFATLPSAWYAAGILSEQLGEVGPALADFQRAMDLGDGTGATRRGRVRTARALCDWRWFDADREWSIAHLAEGYDDEWDTFALLSVPGVGEDLLLARARQIGARLARMGQSATRQPVPRWAAGQRLRIGYLSADFRAHPTAYLAAGVFETHDRTGFELFAYSTSPDDGSAMRRRLEAAFEHFVDVSQEADQQIAERIAADGIHVLIDLGGYTQGARPSVLARRPAPVQVSYLGYPGTLGAPYVDYILADEVVLPRGSFPYYAERAAWIPGTYQCNDRWRQVGPATTRAAHALPEEALVLCCFNNAYKITPDVFDVWCRLLRGLPRCVLWLYTGEATDVRENLRAEAERRGVDPARLVFAGSLPNPEHLARVALADLLLDTLPYNAHTTASDALWVGVPVLTCRGDTFAGRVGASLLHAVGLPEQVTESLPEYEEKARHLLTHPDELASLKRRLLAERDRCRLFDTAGFTRDLEALYLAMWKRHQAGLPPAPLSLDAGGRAVWLE